MAIDNVSTPEQSAHVAALADPLTALVLRAQGRDALAVAALCSQFSPLVYACARRYHGTRLLQDDLIQSGYEHLLQAIYSYDSERAVYFAYYAKIKVRGGIYSYVRSLERTDRRELMSSLRVEETGGSTGRADEQVDGWLERIADPHTAASYALAEWEDLLTSLSPREQLAVRATLIGDFTTSELAEREGVGVESSKTWRKRAIVKLRRALAT